jgi:hypothetical protein
VVALRDVVKTAIAATGVVACVVSDRAEAGGTEIPSFLAFTGTDIWRYGAFLYGGLLWSPAGLDADGFTGIR